MEIKKSVARGRREWDFAPKDKKEDQRQKLEKKRANRLMDEARMEGKRQVKRANNNGWTPQRRARQAANARRHKPWLHATGPKTPAGKAKCARNAIKHDLYGETGRRLRRIFRQ